MAKVGRFDIRHSAVGIISVLCCMTDVTRLLVRAPNWLGDAVMALPALAAVRSAFEGRTLIIAAMPAVAPIFEERSAAAPDEILAIDRARELDQLRGARADGILL